MSPPGVGRRAFLAGAAATAAAAAGGCGRDTRPRDPLSEGRLVTSVQGDVELLSDAYVLEMGAAAAYRELGGGLREFAEHEAEHAERVRAEIRRLGGDPPREPVVEVPARRGAARLRHLLDVEGELVAFYVDMLPKLYDRELRRLVSTIVAVQAEHMSLLRERLGEDPAPEPFVYGWVGRG